MLPPKYEVDTINALESVFHTHTHMPLTVNGAGIDTGAQPDTDEAGLL